MQVIAIFINSIDNKMMIDDKNEVKRLMTAINKPPANINFPPNKCVFLQFSLLFKVHGNRKPAK